MLADYFGVSILDLIEEREVSGDLPSVRLSRNLRYYLVSVGKTIKEFARDLGCSYYSVRRWCSGKAYPPEEMIIKMAAYFGIPAEELLQDKPCRISPAQRSIADMIQDVPEDKLEHLRTIIAALLESWK